MEMRVNMRTVADVTILCGRTLTASRCVTSDEGVPQRATQPGRAGRRTLRKTNANFLQKTRIFPIEP